MSKVQSRQTRLLWRKRTTSCLFIITLCILGLIFRLAQIQLISPESFSSHQINLLEESVKQRTQSWTIDNGRGRFVDQKGEPITHDYYPTLILFPFLSRTDWPIEKIADIINENPLDLQHAVEQAKEPFVYGKEAPLKLTEDQMELINKLQIPGMFALQQQIEIDSNIADHLIGITRENKQLMEKRYSEKIEKGIISFNTKLGITGLQQTFDEFLLPEGEAKLLYHVDNRGGPLFGLNVRYTAPANPYYPTAIKLSIKKQFQETAEEVIDHYQLKKGGLILLDVQNSDILAVVSRPRVQLNNPLEGDGAINQMIIPHFPGSIFKIVTAAAALEKNVKLRGRTFDCNQNLYADGESSRKLGILSFSESFSQSCNYTFASLAEEMMKENNTIIEEYADKLGLIQQVSWKGDFFHFQDFQQIPGERNGTIWGNEEDRHVSKAIAQTAIGQKEVKVSPLAVANMMATIARGGERKEVRAVRAILYKNGTTLYDFPEHELEGDSITSYGASKLQVLLRNVVEEGTGRGFKDLPFSVAGKSGTAETGKANLINKWFAGYFPADNPKYALVVVDLEQKEVKVKTNEIFADYVEKLYEIEGKSSEKSYPLF